MDELIEKITKLEDELVLEACKNFRLGLARKLRKQFPNSDKVSDDSAVDSLRALPLEGTAGEVRDLLLNAEARKEIVELGRLTLIMAAQDTSLRKYVEGAVEGAEIGVRTVDPISILAVGVTIYMLGRLIPNITVKKGETNVEIKPLKDPLQGLTGLIKAISVFKH